MAKTKKQSMKLLIMNGPNLNLLGVREKSVYGNRSFEDYFEELKTAFPDLELEYFQSNTEGALIDKLHEVGFSYKGILLNAGGYTHTSVALSDAIAAITTPVVEVHISNVFAREAFRHRSMIAGKCLGSISGFGLESYRLALHYFLSLKPNQVGFAFKNK
jgi:3-dehydroquinate dehydratase-2